MVDQPLPDDVPRQINVPLLPDDVPLSDDVTLPTDVLSHADTMKFADKIDPFDPTGNRTETQLKFRRYVHTMALRSSTTTDIRGYRRAGFALSTLESVVKKEPR